MPEIRSPGLLERFHIVRHALGIDSCVLSAAKYTHSENLSFSQQVLFPAIRSLITQHPALGIRLSKDTIADQTHFVRLDSFDLSEVIHYVNQSYQELEEVFESEFVKPFDTTRDLPLWRLTVLKDNTIVFAFHHGIGDGLSSVAFHRTLLRVLREQKQGPDSFVEKAFVPENLKLVGASDQLTDISPSWLEVIRAILGLFIPPSWTSASRAWTGHDVPAEIPSLQAYARIVQLPAMDAHRLATLCRTHKATITSALHFIITSSLSKTLQNPTYRSLITNKTTISSGIPVSLRPLTGASKDAICDHPSASTLRTQSKTCKSQIGLLKFLGGNYTGFFQGKLGKKRQTGVELSNLGRFELEEEGDGTGWEIQDIVFAQCDAVVGAAIKVNVASAPSGNMAICVTWGDSAVDHGLVDAFIAEMRLQISEILNGAKN
ncbi:hypothetical protein D9758_006113 [Tetrapyrgos nigripes]|uniref:Alcohol acetyltransferase n=1 Tax=Tetrapyrgos nigripes TaxID=182062 RepID=A0A8H5D9X0_9AGAR|nr:hypothetical protein D9758_006113 [Tetrapyrgos nigripes]